MKLSNLLSATTLASGIYTVYAADAAIVKNNPPGAYALANMPGTDPGNNGVFAEIVASTSSDGEGVEMTLNLNGGTAETGGPFLYHVHEKAVPSDGNCTGTGAHLDPTSRGENPVCDSSKPESCQVGDLSGKHGECKQVPGCSLSFRDKFLSLTPGNPAYIGDKSFVLHYANKTRIACVNFVMSGKGNMGSNSSSSGSGSGSSGGSGSGSSPSSSPPSTTAPGPASRPSSSAPASSTTAAAASLQAAGSFSFTAMVVALLGLTMW